MSAEETSKTYKTFEDLDAHKAAREFRKKMYGVARRLPDFEKFVLADQIRRAALSLTNNIAEGHGRFHFLDQIKFMLQARGSLEELLWRDDAKGGKAKQPARSCAHCSIVAVLPGPSRKLPGVAAGKLLDYVRQIEEMNETAVSS
jgi:23S rRNA-intervening sequence protein